MDLRAFGGIYPYRGEVPYTSGFGIVPPGSGNGSSVHFAACRAIYIISKSSGSGGYLTVELSDAPGQYARADNLKGDSIIPISCTAVHSGDVDGVFILY